MAGLQSTRLVPLLGVPNHDPSRNREMGGAQGLGGCQSFKKCNNQPKDSVSSGGGCLRRDTNKGDGHRSGEQVTAMRAMAMATAMVMTSWAMVMAMRLVGDKEGKGDNDEGGGR